MQGEMTGILSRNSIHSTFTFTVEIRVWGCFFLFFFPIVISVRWLKTCERALKLKAESRTVTWLIVGCQTGTGSLPGPWKTHAFGSVGPLFRPA